MHGATCTRQLAGRHARSSLHRLKPTCEEQVATFKPELREHASRNYYLKALSCSKVATFEPELQTCTFFLLPRTWRLRLSSPSCRSALCVLLSRIKSCDFRAGLRECTLRATFVQRERFDAPDPCFPRPQSCGETVRVIAEVAFAISRPCLRLVLYFHLTSSGLTLCYGHFPTTHPLLILDHCPVFTCSIWLACTGLGNWLR